MEEGLVTALLWLLFGGTHVVLTLRPIRQRLVGGLGEVGFVVVYSLIAILTFAALVHYVALHRFADPHASLLMTIPPVRGALIALSVLGFSLFITAVLVYPRLPMATFRHRVVRPRGVQQITRHPFFSGIAIWAAAHAMLAPSKVTFVFFIGVVALALVGGTHQDRRLVAELGEPRLRRQEPPAEVWQYRGQDCVLDFFLYQDAQTFKVVHIEARDLSARLVETRSCLRRLLEARQQGHGS